MSYHELYKQFTTERIRKQRIRRHLVEDHIGSYVEGEIVKRHTDPQEAAETRRHMDLSFNLFSVAISRMNVLYNEVPHRSFVDPFDTQLYRTVVSPFVDAVAQKALELSLAQGVCFVHPYTKNGRVEYSIIPADKIAVTWETQTTISEALYEIDEDRYVYWDRETYQFLTANMEPLGNPVQHAYGRVPLVCYRTEYPATTSRWSENTKASLVESAVNICVAKSYLSKLRAIQTHLQLAKEKDENDFNSIEGDEVVSGPTSVLEGKWYVLSLQADVKSHQESIEVDIRRAASSLGINEELLTAKNYRSGIHAMHAHLQLAEIRQKLLVWMKPADLELMTLTAIVWNAWNTELRFLGSEPRIEYHESPLPQEEKNILDAYERKIAWGAKSQVDYILEHDPDITTREQAMGVLKRNLEEWKKIQEIRRSFQLPNENTVNTEVLNDETNRDTDSDGNTDRDETDE